MFSKKLKILFRMTAVKDVVVNEHIIEAKGECALTGKLVKRLMFKANVGKIWEYKSDTKGWVELGQGVCQNHSSDFTKLIMPEYSNNIHYLAK